MVALIVSSVLIFMIQMNQVSVKSINYSSKTLSRLLCQEVIPKLLLVSIFASVIALSCQFVKKFKSSKMILFIVRKRAWLLRLGRSWLCCSRQSQSTCWFSIVDLKVVLIMEGPVEILAFLFVYNNLLRRCIKQQTTTIHTFKRDLI